MSFYVSAFLIGIVTGLRTFMGITAVSWAARLHAIHLDDTRLAFLGYAATPYILSLLALGELITDQLPKTPSRLVPPQFIARVVVGALAGAAIGAAHQALAGGLIAGIIGAITGTLGGAKLRGLLAKSFGNDTPAAILEDLVAIALAIFVVTRAAA